LDPSVTAAIIKPLVWKSSAAKERRMLGPIHEGFVSLVDAAESAGVAPQIGVVVFGLLTIGLLDDLVQVV
jgi:hypothetical protein